MSDAPVRLRTLTGSGILPWLDDIARLRIAVFAEWPYLYAGDLAYERDYLARYAGSPRSLFAIALDGDAVVGAATGLPLEDDSDGFQAPYHAAGIDVRTVFYFGESVLLPGWRGRGLGHAFFDAREAHASRLGFRTTSFCAVVRHPDDPRRPPGARTHDAFWRSRGYAPLPGATVTAEWSEPAYGNVAHALAVWMRRL